MYHNSDARVTIIHQIHRRYTVNARWETDSARNVRGVECSRGEATNAHSFKNRQGEICLYRDAVTFPAVSGAVPVAE